MTKQQVCRETTVYSNYVSIKELVSELQEYADKHPDAWTRIQIEDEYTAHLSVEWNDVETDAEYQARLQREKSWIDQRRRLYEELKKEFEGEDRA